MEWGAMFNTDELNFADQGVTGILHAVADTRRALDIPGYRKIVAAPNFQLLATMNVDYAGTHQLNEALDSRYSEIVFDMPESIKDILERACPDAQKKDIEICDKIYKKILIANKENTMCMQVSARNFISALNKVAKGLSLKRALTMNLANKLRDNDYKKAMKEMLDMNCPNK
jgi:midasin (ATPase involved in ribosome maturation)